MDARIRTGSTKVPRDVTLLALPLESAKGEQVCLVMEVTGPEREAASIERACEEVLKNALLDAEGPAAERLDSTLKELNGLMKGMLVSGSMHDIHMLVAILDHEGTLHVSHAGRAEAYLIRRGSASQITEFTASRATPAFVHIASGGLESGDLVVFSTQRLLRTLTPAQLARLTTDRGSMAEMLVRALETEGEHTAVATLDVHGAATSRQSASRGAPLVDRRRRMQGGALRGSSAALPVIGRTIQSIGRSLWTLLPSGRSVQSAGRKTISKSGNVASSLLSHTRTVQDWVQGVLSDLHSPERRRRAHLLLLASALAVVVVVWALVHLWTSSQRSKTRTELEELVNQINVEIQTAENRRIMGDIEASNAVLQRAAERAKQVMDSESGLFRTEANELLSRISAKREEINNILRISPRVVAELSANNPDITAQGMIGISDGEFAVYDRQDLYRVLLNSVESPVRVSDDVLIIDGTNFSRFQSYAFLMNGNSVIEMESGQPITMKTDDTRGWVNGNALEAYLRYLYILAPDNNQIYKYERLQNRYGTPVEYNVNGDLAGALDMAIDGKIYVLKNDGSILKLFRGETQPFTIRQAPEGVLENATKLIKVDDRNFYALDPTGSRVVVFSDGGSSGESAYLRQYVFEGEQIGTLKDLFVDLDEAHLYVMDEKRIYVTDLSR